MGLQEDTAEQEGYAEACVSPRMAETDTADTSQQEEGLLEEILSSDNLYRAYKQVRRTGTQASKNSILLLKCKVWKRRIPNGTYGAV